jgi:hypothetical protein
VQIAANAVAVAPSEGVPIPGRATRPILANEGAIVSGTNGFPDWILVPADDDAETSAPEESKTFTSKEADVPVTHQQSDIKMPLQHRSENSIITVRLVNASTSTPVEVSEDRADMAEGVSTRCAFHGIFDLR